MAYTKYLITVNEERAKMLDDMMKEDAQDNRSVFFSELIIKEQKRRQEEKNKRGPGRPPASMTGTPGVERPRTKEEQHIWENTIDLYYHPDTTVDPKDMNMWLNYVELEGWYDTFHKPVPPDLKPCGVSVFGHISKKE